MALEMVTRDEWGALPATHQNPLRTPIKYTGWSFTGTDTCNTKEECSNLLKLIQKCNMEKKGMADIKHNFLISRDGTIYEGRGWLANTMIIDPLHTNLKGTFIMVARIGTTFKDEPPTPLEIAAKEKIIQYGIENKLIDKDYEDCDILQSLSV